MLISNYNFRGRSLRHLIVFLLALATIFGVFLLGYSYGQKGKSFFGIMAKDVTNTEVGMPSGVDFSLYWQAWNKLQSDSVFDTNSQSMLYNSISGLLSSVSDPYTVFFTPKDNQIFKSDIEGQFDGIGVELVMKNGLPTVVAPLSDSPGAKAGIKAGDIILQVDDVKSADIGFNELIEKIRGKKGTTVKLQIARADADKPLTFSIVRDTITIKSVTWEEKEQTGPSTGSTSLTTGSLGASKKIMYVKVRQFGDDTSSLFADFAAATIKAKPDGIIVDLRDDPGGYFQSAIDLSSYFVDGGTIVEQQNKAGVKQDFSTSHSATLKNFKTAVLVNGGSASASEIFSGALQDRKAGTLIGEKTFGKGSVQELVELKDGSALKITIAKWLTPNGRTINGEGITPDIEIKSDSTNTTDLQLDRALDFIINGK
ncbi:hypothetical protein COT78_02365 [Candidatus Berkelbacteria bacterium CG10_big_fil_rev_8_21_14_0_10_43_13]|uniref:PDZ domain-containing protein n=1 Tax=Candidatus Berkelbacteria bacterium CG10_big_fil_rev_8_21_14_0_10_43_13 TaxID=1974514 RepID=A0A2H0W6D7_9BACT|nr:MAG: hypothetical protein COT78_02365 [Candidatus Berkelbacteria bacterium CG10_big_fil_rev_8_21_14_0_10_43_13]